MTDIFDSSNPNPAQPAPTENVVDALVGENKKFRDLEALAKGKLEADKTIEARERELSELRAELAKRIDAETELRTIREEMSRLREAPNPKENTTPALDAATVQKLVLDTITAQEQSRTRTQNVSQAQSDMVKYFGTLEKAQEAIRSRATELGMSLDSLKDIAEKSPTAFDRLIVGDVKPPVSSTPLQSTVRVDAARTGTFKTGTKAYFDNLRLTNPKEYFKPSTQNAIIKAADEGTYFSE
jgi:hypothetical protein